MKGESEFGTKMRLLHVMLSVLDRPYGYTMRELAERHCTHKDTIKKDFEALKNAGFALHHDSKYRYAFSENKPYQQLKQLLVFTEEDQEMLETAIDRIADRSVKGEALKRKLGTLYDYGRLGYDNLRWPYLRKVDALLQAKEEKRVVVLRNYRSSNSNIEKDRRVEPFHIKPGDDMLHSFDVEKGVLRHFRLSRFKRVQLTEQSWQHEGYHNVIKTDPFRIVDAEQRMVHLRISVGAYNELIERYPLAKQHVQESEVPGVYDFQCEVNHKFLGLTNFILGNYHSNIEVLAPESLRAHLKKSDGGDGF